MPRATLLSIGLMAAVFSVQAQFPGGGGAGSPGIPLSAGGSEGDSDKNDKGDNKSATERPVSGVVTDADGKPIEGAVVQLKNTRTRKIISAITHEKGDFRFSALSKDADYQLTAVFKNRSSAPHTLSTFDTRPKPVVNLQIK